MEKSDEQSYRAAKTEFTKARLNLLKHINNNWDNDYTKILGEKLGEEIKGKPGEEAEKEFRKNVRKKFAEKFKQFSKDTNTHIKDLDKHHSDMVSLIGPEMANENREKVFRLGTSIMNTLANQLKELNEKNNPYVDKDVKMGIIKGIPDSLQAVTNTLGNYLTPRPKKNDLSRGGGHGGRSY